MRIITGLPDAERNLAAELYWEAFGEKLGVVMGPREKGLAFVRRVIDPSHAISAIDDTGKLLGVVGFKTNASALVAGDFTDLKAIYGTFGAVWRAGLLHFLERHTENERFLMDGIFVSASARGRGVGTALLAAIADEARARGYPAVRLDVIDTNTRAKALYLREGFAEEKEQHLGPLRYVFKFNSAVTMVKPL